MAQDALNICSVAISACVQWVDQLINAMGAGGIIFTAFCVCGVISMLFMPFRGAFGIGLGDDYYTSNPIHRPSRRSSGVPHTDPGALSTGKSLTVRD